MLKPKIINKVYQDLRIETILRQNARSFGGVVLLRRQNPEHFNDKIGQSRFDGRASPVQKAAVRKSCCYYNFKSPRSTNTKTAVSAPKIALKP